jgi:hypothetical protein
MATDSSDYRGRLMRRLASLSIRHRAAFAALCAERQYGTYAYASRDDPRLQPGVLRNAIDRCWTFVRGGEVASNELADLKEAVDQLVPNLDEDMSGFANLILDATAAVSYLLNVCLTGSNEDGAFAGECARNAVDEWVIGEIAPSCEGLPESIISMASQLARNRLISSLKLRQQLRPFGLGSSFPHHRAAVDRLTLASGCVGRTIREQVIDPEWFGVDVVGVQRVHQRRPFLDDPNTRVAVAVDPTFVTLG